MDLPEPGDKVCTRSTEAPGNTNCPHEAPEMFKASTERIIHSGTEVGINLVSCSTRHLFQEETCSLTPLQKGTYKETHTRTQSAVTMFFKRRGWRESHKNIIGWEILGRFPSQKQQLEEGVAVM